MNHIIDLFNPLPLIAFPIPMWPCGRDAHRAGTTERAENDNEAAGCVELFAPDEGLIQSKALNGVMFTVKLSISIAPFGRDGYSALTVTLQASAPDSLKTLCLSDISGVFFTRCQEVTRSDKAPISMEPFGRNGDSVLAVTSPLSAVCSVEGVYLDDISAVFFTRCGAVTRSDKGSISIAPFALDGHSASTVTTRLSAGCSLEGVYLSDVSSVFITRCGGKSTTDKAPISIAPSGRDAHRALTVPIASVDAGSAWMMLLYFSASLFTRCAGVTKTDKASIFMPPFGRDGHSALTGCPACSAPRSSGVMGLSDFSASLFTRCGGKSTPVKDFIRMASFGRAAHSSVAGIVGSFFGGFQQVEYLSDISAGFITGCASAASIPGVRIHMPTGGADAATNPQSPCRGNLYPGGASIDFPGGFFTRCQREKGSIFVSTGMDAGGMDAGRDAGHGYSIEFSSGTADFTVKDLDLADRPRASIPAGLFTRCQPTTFCISESINTARFK